MLTVWYQQMYSPHESPAPQYSPTGYPTQSVPGMNANLGAPQDKQHYVYPNVSEMDGGVGAHAAPGSY